MFVLENEFMIVKVAQLGAELRSVYDKNREKERMWEGDSRYWGRVSPVLFPIVGKLKDDYYLYEGNKYSLERHGFLRDQDFELVSQSEDHLCLAFESDAKSYECYPFHFRIEIEYLLNMRSVEVSWRVINQENRTMYYSIGAHPAFRLDESFPYRFSFPVNRHAQRIELKDGLVYRREDVELEFIDIEADLFKNDALIFENVDAISLEKKNSNESIRVEFKGFPYLGLWSPYESGEIAPFVCIEPWHGIADTYQHNHQLEKKQGICSLPAQEEQSYRYTILFQ